MTLNKQMMRLKISVRINFRSKVSCCPGPFSFYRYFPNAGPRTEHVWPSDFNQSTNLSSDFCQNSLACVGLICQATEKNVNPKLKQGPLSKPFLSPVKRTSISPSHVLSQKNILWDAPLRLPFSSLQGFLYSFIKNLLVDNVSVACFYSFQTILSKILVNILLQ